ncbi:tRNA-guanine transglycosylase DpdA [Terrabacter sp. Root181]|uniref:tRNA-guanine transglycosylase DpdA n=1 Tax=Terrabacter sp. Root181 TaxID=1736484 RepID=UPI0006F826EB|nr:tRNA-guanine transglycosylase DpdA [Terrabacter sp. Root181]KRB47079.1 queuine/other tRNA-ribosyltransferase [Terrabacter sp. Root181]
MRFYFPDSQDLVSPTYDFQRDEYSPLRVRQRDDRYAHEVLDEHPYHGLLVSKSIVDGSIRGAGKYTGAQRARLYRLGVREFFRLTPELVTLGDNGAFNYADELVPPVTVDETLDFYEGCGFDAGVSVDHIIFGYAPEADFNTVDPAWAQRRLLTLRLAEEFITRVADRGTDLEPVGAAQGWSPTSYADSVKQLQDFGYRRIALGGMVPLKTRQIVECLEAIDGVRAPETEFHLLGITRVESMGRFAEFGVTSFDSTSAFRQAFMDDRLNFHTRDEAYVALRVPQVDGNPTLRRAVLAGRVSQRDAVSGERECLRALRAYDGTESSMREVLAALARYETICQSKKSYLSQYERTLRAAPWAKCSCSICRELGIEVAIFRGTERNKRRGFHNLSVLAHKIQNLSLPHPTEDSHG